MATENLAPDSDVTTADWVSTASDYYTEIDEDWGSQDEADYIYTSTFDSPAVFGISDIAGDFSLGTDFTIKIHARLDHQDYTAVLKVEYSMDGGTSWTVAGYCDDYDSETDFTFTVTENYGITKINDFQVRLTFLETV